MKIQNKTWLYSPTFYKYIKLYCTVHCLLIMMHLIGISECVCVKNIQHVTKVHYVTTLVCNVSSLNFSSFPLVLAGKFITTLCWQNASFSTDSNSKITVYFDSLKLFLSNTQLNLLLAITEGEFSPFSWRQFSSQE